MLVLLLILLLFAAISGVLGTVLELTLVIVLSLVLSVVLLAWIGLWYAKRRVRQLQRDLRGRIDHDRRRREAYDVGRRTDDARPGSSRRLGDGG